MFGGIKSSRAIRDNRIALHEVIEWKHNYNAFATEKYIELC